MYKQERIFDPRYAGKDAKVPSANTLHYQSLNHMFKFQASIPSVMWIILFAQVNSHPDREHTRSNRSRGFGSRCFKNDYLRASEATKRNEARILSKKYLNEASTRRKNGTSHLKKELSRDYNLKVGGKGRLLPFSFHKSWGLVEIEIQSTSNYPSEQTIMAFFVSCT